MYDPIRTPTIFYVLLCTSVYATGCDTCNNGETFVNPRIASGFEQAEDQIYLVIEWDQGPDRASDLPEEYFSSVSLIEGGVCLESSSNEECMALYYGALYSDSYQYTVFFSESVPEIMASSSFEFKIYLPDRRQYIDCRHPGSDDSYSLLGTIFLDDTGEIIESSFIEELSLGHI